MSDLPRILCVDDEANILKAIQRSLRKKFAISTAGSGKEGLEVLQREGPFEVVVSDMKMPEMNGALFLKHVRKLSPHTVRLLLTGFADIDSVVSAVNQGNIYRFLSKPCPAQVLAAAIDDAVAQHRLLTSQKVLLEQTLKGSIKALTDILSMANPAAFGRASRIRNLAVALAGDLGMEELWEVEVAAMFCMVGSITLPAETAMKLYRNEPLDQAEKAMVARIPEMSRSILANIPRLEPVLNILLYMEKNFDGTGQPTDSVAADEIPLGARILKLAEAAEKRQSMGDTPGRVLDYLHAQEGVFDPAVLQSFSKLSDAGDIVEEVRGVSVHELRTGMVLTEEVRSRAGVLLVAAGQEVSVSLLERIQNYHDTIGLELPLWVRNPELIEDEAAEQPAPEGITV